jgi:hypothetical protein
MQEAACTLQKHHLDAPLVVPSIHTATVPLLSRKHDIACIAHTFTSLPSFPTQSLTA